MRRRELIALAGGMAVWPLAAHALQSMPVIGFVSDSAVKMAERFLAGVRKGLAEKGYVEGQNYQFEFREANYQIDLLPVLYRELVNQKVSLILAYTTLRLEQAKAATQSIPIVFLIGVDPVENGFVASLNRPGGNITGIFNYRTTLGTKQLQILYELVPSATKFAFLSDPGNAYQSKLGISRIDATAHSLGLSILNVNAHTSGEFEAAFETAVRGGAGGMIVGPDAIFVGASTQLAAVAAHYALPTIFYDDISVKAGGLIAYGADLEEGWRLVGHYAARILKGEKPADLPVQQATKLKLIINLKTAVAMGITVPAPVLARADEVIE